MKRIVAAALLVVASCGGTQAADVPPQPVTAAGRYAQHCSTCHGKELQGRTAQALATGSAVEASDEEYFAQISDGRRGMPAFGGRLTSGEIDGLIAFIREQQVSSS